MRKKTSPIDAARLKYEAALKASTRKPAPRIGRGGVSVKPSTNGYKIYVGSKLAETILFKDFVSPLEAEKQMTATAEYLRRHKNPVAKKTVKRVVRRANPVVKKKYFVMGRDGQLEITTPTYIVSLPIALDYPIVARELLIVHKSVDTKGWTVTHAATGYAFSRGETRAKAILNAQSAIIKYGEEKIMNSIHRVGG